MKILVLFSLFICSWSFAYDTLVAKQNIPIIAETKTTTVLVLPTLDVDGMTQRVPAGRCFLELGKRNYDRQITKGSIFYILSKKVRESSPTYNDLLVQVNDFFDFDFTPFVKNKREIKNIIENKYELDVRDLFVTYKLKIKSVATGDRLTVKCNLYPIILNRTDILKALAGTRSALVPGKEL